VFARRPTALPPLVLDEFSRLYGPAVSRELFGRPIGCTSQRGDGGGQQDRARGGQRRAHRGRRACASCVPHERFRRRYRSLSASSYNTPTTAGRLRRQLMAVTVTALAPPSTSMS
jgi:hypothetical protein